MNEPENVRAYNQSVLVSDNATLVEENKELRRMLWWALGWVNAKARISHRAKYEHAVRLTKQPDPQEWRDR